MKTNEQHMAEQATGCPGAGDYALWAKEQGYPHCQVWDWTSSAGDWTFLVSKDGQQWHWMSQSNNWPRQGFTRTIDTENFYEGTAQEVLYEAEAELEALNAYTNW